MFEGITSSLQNAFGGLRGTRITEKNIREAMKTVRQALLEADVNYEVAQDFVNTVTEQAVGDRVLKSLRPDEQILGIVGQELVNLMGPEATGLDLKRDGITVLMMCGLQGAGKTTTCGKLAKYLKRQGLPTMLVAADLQRPAAIEQLKTLGSQIDAPVYTEDPAKSDPVKVCRNAVKAAKADGDIKVVILDTAGRLHVDDALMKELQAIDNKCQPDSVMMVCDAMTGQDAVNSAKSFNEALELDGVILTKLDGDTRGGAALSVKAVTGVPIKFIGTGEDLDGLEFFRPEGMASRILGQGDLGSLIDDIRGKISEEELREQEERMKEGKFTLNDFRDQMKKMSRLGSMSKLLGKIPGMSGMLDAVPDMDPDKDMKRIGGIIDSMTPKERENPELIDRSRRNRIARGCGQDPADVNGLLKQFRGMAQMMQQMAGKGMMERMKMAQSMMGEQMANPGGELQAKKQRSRRGPDLNQQRADRKKKRKQTRKSRKKNR